MRFGIGISLILILFAAVNLFTINKLGFLTNLTGLMYRHPLTVSNAVLRVDANIVRIHSSMKDVVQARDISEINDAIHQVEIYESRIYQDFDIISEYFLGAKSMVDNARQALADWKPLRDEVIGLIQQGKRDEAAAIIRGRGARHAEKLNRTMMTLHTFAQNKAIDFLDDTRSIKMKTMTISYSLVISTMLIGTLVIIFINWSVTRPLSELMGAVLEVSLGDLDKKIPVRTKDEIGQLAKAFNKMSSKLQESHTNLEEKVKQRTLELDKVNESLKIKIQQHQQAEEELRLRAQSLANMLDGVSIVKQYNGLFLYVNPAFEMMFGYNRNELLGKHFSIINAPTDKSPQQTAKDIISALKTSGVWEGEVTNIKKDGTLFWTHAKVSTFNHSVEGSLWIFVQEDITQQKQINERLRASLDEKETLLRELYHRTKNNMQVIRSMLMLQAGFTSNKEVKRIFQETENKILAMALVHEKLYQSKDLSSINLHDYIRELAKLLVKSYSVEKDKVSLVLDIENIYVLLDTAIPCGLLLNELVSNIMKHAFPGSKKGEILVRISRTDQKQIELLVADNGIGVPDGFDFRAKKSLGLQTIFIIAEHQLQGEIKFEVENGVSCFIRFKDRLYSPRV
ncbi:PAS domain S-box protein [candidate division KSB1 bacterium]|nr:PAS domain S-box protein [candidate division KSB1 bacterium]